MTTDLGTVGTSLEAARKDLLDLGLRNPLLNYRLLRSRGVEVIDGSASLVFQMLVRDGKAASFVPVPETRPLPLPPEPAAQTIASAPRRGDLKLQTALPTEQLEGRLLKTYYAARTHIQERGANILYLAIGMLRWFEAPQSQEERQAPLLLLPVQLERSSAGARFQLTYTGEDIEDNLSLAAKLSREFGMTMPALPDAEDLDVAAFVEGVSHLVQHQPRWAVEHDRIVVGFFSFGKFMMYRDLDAATWPPDAQPAVHPVLAPLLGGDGFREPPPPFGEDDNVDTHLAPGGSPEVVDADSSQTLALLTVSSGRNLVIQGPPGTGKSQTITNLIADAIHRGRTVLFVAEKMAALEVVKRRLDATGLGVACLELHSQKAHKTTVIRDLAATLALGRPRVVERSHDITTLADLRIRLSSYSVAMNTLVANTGVTPHQAFGELLQLREQHPGIVWPRLTIPAMSAWSQSDFQRRNDLVVELQSFLAAVPVAKDHPLWSTRRTVLSPLEQVRLRETINAAQIATGTLRATATHLATLMGVSPLPSAREEAERLSRAGLRAANAPDLHGVQLRRDLWQMHQAALQELLAVGGRLAALHAEYDPLVKPDAWVEDLVEAQQVLREYSDKWWRPLSGAYRRAQRTVASLYQGVPPKDVAQRQAMVDAIVEAQRHHQFVRGHEGTGTALLGAQWQSTQSDWATLSQVHDWVVEMYHDIEAGQLLPQVADMVAGQTERSALAVATGAVRAAMAQHQEAVRAVIADMGLAESLPDTEGGQLEDASFEKQEETLHLWAQSLGILQAIIAAKGALERCQREGLNEAHAVAESWPLASMYLVAAFRRSWFEAIIERAFKERGALAEFDGTQHTQAITRFRELDTALFGYNRARLADEHWHKLPRHEAGGQLGILRREFEKKTRHLPIRQLMQRAGNAIQAIKPVFMMSPLSVATFLPQGSLTFDLVVFDEASQVKPVDALGAILRARQVVVVGDDKQLPPTSFFDAMLSVEETEAEETVTDDIESILGLFRQARAHERMLRWHYRSRHESLIAVSNSEFYNHRLIVFPSPDASRERLGLVYRHLPQSSYDRGRSRTNVDEARVVAQTVMEHARMTPHLTLGVAAFSVAQMQAIQDQLELLRRADPSREPFFTDHAEEPFFVKNLETVQGDERDVIFISIGYGRTAEGYLAMDFGPLNRDGGERRLNVLITRARLRCEVFTNLTADDLDLVRTQARGVRALKTFLSYAQHGRLDVPEATGREPDSPFEEAVVEALRAVGYAVQPQVGSAGFFIDLAIIDPDSPGRYLLGIECDGATYHSARSARDRDRLRQQVLERLGWRIHRIWSTDWFRDPASEMRRVVEAIDQARKATQGVDREQSVHAPLTARDADGRVLRDATQPSDHDTVSVPNRLAGAILPYQLALLQVNLGGWDLHEVSEDLIAQWIGQVVAVESPVHVDEVARRITTAAGIRRIGSRIDEAIRLGCHLAARRGLVRQAGSFLWTTDMRKPPLRDRSGLPTASRKLELVASEEIGLAVRVVVGTAYGMEEDAIAPAVGQLLGFGRVSDDMRGRIEAIVADMLRDQQLVQQGTHLILPDAGQTANT